VGDWKKKLKELKPPSVGYTYSTMVEAAGKSVIVGGVSVGGATCFVSTMEKYRKEKEKAEAEKEGDGERYTAEFVNWAVERLELKREYGRKKMRASYGRRGVGGRGGGGDA
jgi:hypothetical protein